jgi:hypothetical protein
MASFFTFFIFADGACWREKRLWMVSVGVDGRLLYENGRTLWLKGLNGVGDLDGFAILRWASG